MRHVTDIDRHERAKRRSAPARRTARTVVRDALRRTAAELERALDALDVDVTGEAVHASRVAIRRARTVLDLGDTIFVPGSVDELRNELHWMMDGLGVLRDLDVMISRLRALDADPAVLGALEQDRTEAVDHLRAMLALPRRRALVTALDRFAKHPPTTPQADDPASKHLRPIVRARWRKLSRAVVDLGGRPDSADLHRVRILAKRCRYTCELFEPEFGPPAGKMARRLRTLQEELGALNDTRVLVAHLERLAATHPDLSFVAGAAAGTATSAEVSDRTRWRDAWDRVDRKRLRRWL